MLSKGCVIGILLLLSAAAQEVSAQATAAFNQRDDQYRVLGLKRAKEAYDAARADYERQKELFSRKLISAMELEGARRTFSDAEVNFQQSLLAVLFEEQYVSVAAAVKYYAGDGTRHVRVTLANTSGGSPEFRKLLNIEDELFRSLQPDVVTNIYVSVLNDESAIIGQPYEIKIDELRFGEPQTIDFALLQDLDAVTIHLIYSNGSQRTMKVFLQKDAAVNRVAVQSEQFSQEADLGTSATFDLTLELYSGSDNTFSLEAVNLPLQVSRSFKDPTTKARLSQLRFNESTRTKKAVLEISLPDRPSDEIVIDRPIDFFVAAVPRDKAERMGDLQARQWTQADLEGLDVGFVRLELLPRGKGKLLVRSPQLFQAIRTGESAKVRIDLVNEGSHRLDNVKIEADLPLNWTKLIEPSLVASLDIGEEKPISLSFTPPEDAAAGKYDVRVRTIGASAGEQVSGEDKTVTVEILPQANLLGTTLIVVLIIGLVATVVVFGARLARR